VPAICNICGETFEGVGPGRQWGHDTNVCAATTPAKLRARIAELEAALSRCADYLGTGGNEHEARLAAELDRLLVRK